MMWHYYLPAKLWIVILLIWWFVIWQVNNNENSKLKLKQKLRLFLSLPNEKSWIQCYVVIILIAFIAVWKTFSFLGMKLTVNAIQVSCIIFSFYFQFFLLSFSSSLYFIKTTEGKHSLQSITFPRKSNRSKYTLDFDLFIYSALWSIPMFSGMWISQMLEPLLVTK